MKAAGIKNKLQAVAETLRNSGLMWTVSLVLSRIGIPVLRMWPEKQIDVSVLQDQIGAVLRQWGMSEQHIATSVRHISYADLHGIDSHGCSMLPYYHRLLGSGSITMTPRIDLVREGPTTALIDGGGGLGHVPADMAMSVAIGKCRAAGVGVVAVRNSGHFGAAGSYAEMAAQAGLIGFAMTNVGSPALVPTHGSTAMLGTNPIAFAAPARKNRPFLLDMATTIVPVGKVDMARRRGRSIPSGWAYGRGGQSTTNPDIAIAQRRMVPLGGTPTMGGHKGYGLAAMVEILSSVLSGHCETSDGVGHFFLALDPGMFTSGAAFGDNLDSLLDRLRSTNPTSAGIRVRVAGDPEYEAAENNLLNGIPLTRSVIEDIRMVCRKSGAPFLIGRATDTHTST